MSEHLNHFTIHNGVTLGVRYGEVQSVRPVGGLHPHLAVRYEGGATEEWSPATATALALQLPEALAALTALGGYPGCSGAAWGGDDQ